MDLRWMRSRIFAALGTSGFGALSLVSACRSSGTTGQQDGGGVATSQATAQAPQPPPGSRTFAKCEKDQMRDALCIGFPGPHANVDSCPPWTTTVGANVYDMKHLQTTLPKEVALDEAVTARYRAYKPPSGGTSNGEVCCYSYCVADLIKPAARNNGGRSLCFDAPEAGTSLPAAAPYSECAAGLLVGGEQTAFAAEITTRTRSGTDAGPWIDSQHACCYSMNMGFLGRLYRPSRSEPPRVAATSATPAWTEGEADLGLHALAPSVREQLAARRAKDAQLEHASVASFAHVSLELLALGAPPELVRGAHEAALDEIEHARIMYGLASAYRGSACGPGPLDTSAPPSRSPSSERSAALAAFAANTLEDACVAETAGAVMARRCAEAAQSPALRRSLERIAEDEARHAELAWQMLGWAVREGGARVASELRQRLAMLMSEPLLAAEPSEGELELEPHGVLSSAEERSVLHATLRDVVAPCTAALLA